MAADGINHLEIARQLNETEIPTRYLHHKLKDYVVRIEKGKIRMEELEQIKSDAQAELKDMQTASKSEEIPDDELAELSVLESFDKERLKALIDKVIVYGADAIEIVWKVGNPFKSEITT